MSGGLVVFLGSLITLEPVVIRGRYNRGGFYRSLPYIPSSTISGALVSHFFQETDKGGDMYENLAQRCVWLSHAYPWDKDLGMEDPLPLPLRTLAKKRGKEEYVSTAVAAARIIDETLVGDETVDKIRELDPKVGTVFFSTRDFQRSYTLEAYTHVSIDFRSRSHGVIRRGEEEMGLLYTTESIPTGSRFVFKGFVDEEIYDMIKNGVKVRVGSYRNKGYGEVKIEVLEEMNLDDYRELRRNSLAAHADDRYMVLDVVTWAFPQYLEENLGPPIYERSRRGCFKVWLNGKFHIYKGVAMSGSVFMYRNKKSVDDYVRIETTPPDDPISRLHGLNMVFFNNPVHFVWR